MKAALREIRDGWGSLINELDRDAWDRFPQAAYGRRDASAPLSDPGFLTPLLSRSNFIELILKMPGGGGFPRFLVLERDLEAPSMDSILSLPAGTLAIATTIADDGEVIAATPDDDYFGIPPGWPFRWDDEG